MSERKKTNIGVFFGSRSPEHDVSIITAQLIISGLKGLGYSVTPIYISKMGDWLIDSKLGELSTFTDSGKKADLAKFGKYYLDLEQSRGCLVFRKKGFAGGWIKVDVAFPALHGSFGEDGTIQGIFEMFNVPYVGCGVSSSAVAMDKTLTKLFYQANQIPTTKFVAFTGDDWTNDKGAIIQKIKQDLTWPVFVKPARLGSSIAITKITKNEIDKLQQYVEVALHYDSKVLVEEGVENLMDITCCVLGNSDPIPSLLQESVFSEGFFSYEDKYLKEGGAQFGKAASNIFIPARLDGDTSEAIRECAVKAYRLLGCSGIARVDFLYDKKTKNYYANEINPLPGTLYHHLWEKSGVKLDALLDRLLRMAEEKHREGRKLTYTFESDILKKAGSKKLKFGKG